MDMSVTIAGVKLKNPVVTASGTCGFGEEYLDYYKPEELGAIAVKGLTLLPREGNPPPRIAETPSGMLNSIGLQNPGVEMFVKKHLPRLKERGATVIANIAGSSADDYARMTEILSDTDVDFIEMNISCPNVKQGGVHFGTDPRIAEEVVKAARLKSKKPLIVKLSPNVADITEIARAAEAAGADCLSMINTLLGMRIDIETRRPILKNNVGGLSGACVKPIAVRMIWQVRRITSLPIIGMGGVCTASDAIELMIAGANAIAIGSAAFKKPDTPRAVIKGIADYMKLKSIRDISDISGSIITY
ncbi:MAG: dihydroorotate dehydrogenase [Oscillospiraceae bacterium]|nr:dihydroorotate dehydrogenase [Oscillospiraceae bacterium]